MFIAIEGPDGAGKTTAINALTMELWRRGRGTVLVNPKRSPNHPAPVEYIQNLGFYEPETGVDLILDRSWYSEDVYGPIWRGIGLPSEDRVACEAWALSKGCLVVILDEYDEVLESRIAASLDDDPDAKHMEPQLVREYAFQYREQRTGWKLPTILFPPGFDFEPDPVITLAEVYSRLAKEAAE
jgi:thymidylate kinase